MMRLTTKRILDITKTVCILVLTVAICFILKRVDGFITTVQPKTITVLDDTHKAINTLNTDLQTLDTNLRTFNETLVKVKETIASTKEMVDTQKQFQKEQNEKVLAVLEQSETALINFQRQMEEIKDSTVGAEKAAQAAIEKLTPVLEETVKTIQTAHGVIGDSNIKKAIEQMAITIEHTAGVMSNFEKTSAHIEKKVGDMTKPVTFWKTAIQTLLRIAANARQAIGR